MATDLEDLTLGSFIACKARENGQRTFLRYLPDGRTYSYADVDRLTNAISHGLIKAGISHGDHVAVMMDNCPEQVLAYFALAKCGAVSVPVNTAARGHFLRYYLEHSDAVACIAEPEYLAYIADVLPDLRDLRLAIMASPDADADCQKRLGGTIPLLAFAALADGDDTPPDVEVRFSDLAMLSYTSGTTGPSKANMMVQATHLKAALAGAAANQYRPSDVIYICLPTNHTNGLWSLLQAMTANASVALARRFSVSSYWKDIAAAGATYTNILGSMVSWLWNVPERSDDSENSLRACHIVPMPPFTKALEQRFGVKVLSGYGLTDFCTAASFGLSDPASKIGSAGRARPGVIIQISDDFDRPVAPGETGEILLRTDDPWSIAQGYYKMPDATVAANRNQWFHTGDRGYLDADGYLYFTDRKKDSIRRRGENISAFEVETIIAAHPAVGEVAVYPVAAESEDEVAATVVIKDGAVLDELSLATFCENNMARYMVPRFIEFATSLPRTPSQKIEKFRLRAAAEQDLGRFWDREKTVGARSRKIAS